MINFFSIEISWYSNFPKNHEICLLHRIWFPEWPKVVKVLFVFNYFDVSTRPSQKQLFRIRLSRSQLTLTSFWIFPKWNYFWLCPVDWNNDRLKLQNVQLRFLVCRFLNWLISKAMGLNSFNKISLEIFLVNFGSFVQVVQVICCMLDQF